MGPVVLEQTHTILVGQRDRARGRVMVRRPLHDHAGSALGQEHRPAPRHDVEGRHHASGRIERDLAAAGPGARQLGRIEPGLDRRHQQGRLGRIPVQMKPVGRGPEAGVIAQGRRGQQQREMAIGEGDHDAAGRVHEAPRGRTAAAVHRDPTAAESERRRRHLVLGHGAGLVRADHGGRAERLHRGQPPDQRAAARESPEPGGERERHDRGQAFGHGGDGEADRRLQHQPDRLAVQDARQAHHRADADRQHDQSPAQRLHLALERRRP